MQSALPARRSFLRGSMRAVAAAIRPPWALGEAEFISACTRCDACIDACPTSILMRADGGFPGVDFSRGECTFCADCVTACEPRALVRVLDEPAPWALRAQIGRACLAEAGVECRVCGERCPTVAIRFRPRLGGVALPQLDAAACTGCGACFAPCPTRAILIKAGNEIPTESEQ
ncbi:MAG TPA: ferredoxin-type protein NapF [Thauera sp.]|nr:ferredoxin-type protein NapF [Thauera sp.]HRA80897.1 ferredoxin-type protein NapF [Thauera sp.]